MGHGPGDNKFLPSLLAEPAARGIPDHGDGTQSVDLVHVDDLVACVLRVRQEPRTAGKAYNLTNPQNPSWNEMIAMVCAETGLPLPRGHLPFRTAFLLAGIMELLSRLSGKPPRLNRYTLRVVGRPYRYLTDAAQRDLGFAPSIGLLDGLRQCLETTRERDQTAEAPILVIGAGAIGGVLGGLLARSGRHVAFLVRSEEAARRLRTDGLKVSGVRGDFTVRVEASHRPADLAGPFDLVLVAVKGYDLAAALRPALGLVAPAGLVVSLQNGVAIEDLEALAGADRAVGCMVGWGATLHPDGTAELTSEGSLVIGSRSARAQARLEPLRATLGAAFPTTISTDILADLYSKLIVNSCVTSLGALSGRTLGWMLAKRRYRIAFIGIIREAMAVADALGIKSAGVRGQARLLRIPARPGTAGRLAQAPVHPAHGREVPSAEILEPAVVGAETADRGRLVQRLDRPQGPGAGCAHAAERPTDGHDPRDRIRRPSDRSPQPRGVAAGAALSAIGRRTRGTNGRYLKCASDSSVRPMTMVSVRARRT